MRCKARDNPYVERKMYWKSGLIAPVAMAALSGAVMLLWNALIPDLLHGPIIGSWQALVLLALSHILLGRHSGRNWRQAMWHRRMHEKMAGMTAEEREAFFRSWHPHERCRDGDLSGFLPG